MILLRLLSAGKTLMGGQGERSYQLPHSQALPKFGGKKNPFRATTLPEHPAGGLPAERTEARRVPELEPVRSSGAAGATAPAEHCEAAPARQAEPVSVAPVKACAAGAQPCGLVAGVRSVLKKFSRPSPGAGAAPANTRPLQGELRLECVRVVRNDLSESDIEIVPRQEKPAAAVSREGGPVSADAEEAVLGTAWSRVSARIFGPNNVR